MEGLQKFYSKIVEDTKSAASSSSSSLSDFAENLMQEKRGSSNLTSYDGAGILVNRPPSGVSVWTCSKLCAVFFVAGVCVGYTLKRRVRKWASKLLRRLKDD
uniref:Transmembrane protein n=1 Tax=Noccaea caerulescens TaxID=107243 RepID=A0A1J3HYE6_NOCCA